MGCGASKKTSTIEPAGGGGGVAEDLWQLLDNNLDLDDHHTSNTLETLAKGGFTTVELFKKLDEEAFKKLQGMGLKPAVEMVRAEKRSAPSRAVSGLFCCCYNHDTAPTTSNH